MNGNQLGQESTSQGRSSAPLTFLRGVTAGLVIQYQRARTVREMLHVAAIARLDGNRALANLALYDAYYQIDSVTEAQDVHLEARAQGNAYMALKAHSWRPSLAAS